MKIKKILTLIILVVMITLVISNDVKAITPYNGNYVTLKDVSVVDNTHNNTKKWLLATDGYYYYDYDGGGTLDNGLFDITDYITITSTSINYTQLEFVALPSNTGLVFDLSELTYIEFAITYDSVNDVYNMTIINDAIYKYNGYQYTLDPSTYLRINSTNEIDFTTAVNTARQQGFIQGSEAAKSTYGYFINDQWITASAYGSIRYNDGLADSDSNAIALKGFIPGILGAVFSFFFQVASIGVLGVSILDIIGALLGIVVLLWVIKMLTGK